MAATAPRCRSPAAPAARLTDSTLHAERAAIVGGSHNAAFVGVPAAGIGNLPAAEPNVRSLENVPVWLQALQITGPVLTLRASTIAGGTIR